MGASKKLNFISKHLYIRHHLVCSLKEVKMNKNYLIIGFTLILFFFATWYGLVVPRFTNMPSDYSLTTNHIGRDRIISEIGGELSEVYATRDTLNQYVTGVDGNVLIIESKVTDTIALTGEEIFTHINELQVDRKTKKIVKDFEGYFGFPRNVQKQEYLIWHPQNFDDIPFTFQKTDMISGLEVYLFTCDFKGVDLTAAFPQFENKLILFDGKCKTWIEPVTGNEIKFELAWDVYFDEDRAQVELGGKETSEETIINNVLRAQNDKFTFVLLKLILPSLLVITVFIIVLLLSLTKVGEK